MRQPAKGHLCHVPMAARLVHVSPSRWRGRGGRVTAQTPPPVTLPWAHLLSSASSPQRGGRAAGSIGRKINSRLSGRRRLRPSSPLLLPRRHRAQPREAPGIAGQRTGSSSHLWQHPAGRSGRAEAGLAPGAGQGCRQRGCRAAVPAGHRQSLEAAGSSIMSGSDKGAQLGCPGQSDKGTVIFVLQEREKNLKGRKKENPLYVFPAARPLPCSGAAKTRERGQSHRSSPTGQGPGGRFLGFWEQIKGPGQRATPRGAGLGGAEPGWLWQRRMPHGTGSAALASRHPAVPPRHLCNELAGLSPGHCKLEGGLSPSEPPLAVGPCRGGIRALLTGQMGLGFGTDAGHVIPAPL